MADYTITITNTLSLLGGDLTSNWGTMLWGDAWGTSGQVVQDVGKYLANTLVLDESITALEMEKVLSNTLSIDTDIVTEYLTNGIWYTVFPGNVTNSNDRISTDYASGGAGSGSYASVTTPATVWS